MTAFMIDQNLLKLTRGNALSFPSAPPSRALIPPCLPSYAVKAKPLRGGLRPALTALVGMAPLRLRGRLRGE